MELLQEEKHSGWSAGVGYNDQRESFIFKNGLAHRYLHGGEGKRQAPFQRIHFKVMFYNRRSLSARRPSPRLPKEDLRIIRLISTRIVEITGLERDL